LCVIRDHTLEELVHYSQYLTVNVSHFIVQHVSISSTAVEILITAQKRIFIAVPQITTFSPKLDGINMIFHYFQMIPERCICTPCSLVTSIFLPFKLPLVLLHMTPFP